MSSTPLKIFFDIGSPITIVNQATAKELGFIPLPLIADKNITNFHFLAKLFSLLFHVLKTSNYTTFKSNLIFLLGLGNASFTFFNTIQDKLSLSRFLLQYAVISDLIAVRARRRNHAWKRCQILLQFFGLSVLSRIQFVFCLRKKRLDWCMKTLYSL